MSDSPDTRRLDERRLIEDPGELVFVFGTLLGVAAFALGLAFLIIGLWMGTKPPAPYFESSSARLLTIAIAAAAIVGGLVLVRLVMRFARW